MKIKRTFAPTMREALQLVKQEQGADAVILGNNKVPGGVEILSAIDFDEVAVASMAASAAPPGRAGLASERAATARAMRPGARRGLRAPLRRIRFRERDRVHRPRDSARTGRPVRDAS